MSNLVLEGLRPTVAGRIEPFITEAMAGWQPAIHSIYLVGSSLTDDYAEGRTDANTVILLHEMDLGFLEHVATLGRAHCKKLVAAPHVLTKSYVMASADVFPIEYLGIKLVHKLIYGDEDVFAHLDIPRDGLRIQCEREARIRLIGLGRSYVSFMGDPARLERHMADMVRDAVHLMRGLIKLVQGAEPPVLKNDVVRVICDISGADCGLLLSLLKYEPKRWGAPSKVEVNARFRALYSTMERIVDVTNDI